MVLYMLYNKAIKEDILSGNTNNVESLKSLLADCNSQLFQIEKIANQRAIDNFENNRGCQKCMGRGWVVTWDTMDSMSGCYHESSACDDPGCSSETRAKSGLYPRNTKYDGFHDNSTWQASYTAEESERKAAVFSESTRLKSEIYVEESRWSVSVGKVVRCVKEGKGPKSRRVPIGTTGIVKKIHTNDWGTTKCIVMDASGKQWWPHINNVEVTDPSPDLSVWETADQTNREVTGFPVVVTVKKVSSKAALVKTTRAAEFWVPQSQVPELGKARAGSVISVCLPMWLAKKKGLLN